MKPFALAAYALAIIALSASRSGAATTPNDPCARLSKADVAAAIGTPVASVSSRPLGPTRACTFRGTKPFKSVIVTAYRWASKDEAATAFHTIETQTSAMMSPTFSIAGLGSEAKSIGGNVYVRVNDSAYVIALIDGSVGSVRAARAIALARKLH